MSIAHQRLRTATRDAHRALEDDLDAVGQLSSGEGRLRLVARYLPLHEAADAVIARWLPHLDQRRRAGQVRADLAAIGGEEGDTPPAPAIASPSEALGFLYVVEGSTLGGRMILRQVEARGGDLAGLGFMDPYGAGTGEAWRSFLGELERSVGEDPDRLDEAEAGALSGFAYARACLVAP